MKRAMSEEQKQQLSDQNLANQNPEDQTPATMPPKNPKIENLEKEIKDLEEKIVKLDKKIEEIEEEIGEEIEEEIEEDIEEEIERFHRKTKIVFTRLFYIGFKNAEKTKENIKLSRKAIDLIKNLKIPKEHYQFVQKIVLEFVETIYENEDPIKYSFLKPFINFVKNRLKEDSSTSE